MHSDAQVER